MDPQEKNHVETIKNILKAIILPHLAALLAVVDLYL
jgi:hypothetical protein